MNRIAVLTAVLAVGAAGVCSAQTPPSSSQSRPDASYPNPSGQDSKPNKTPPKKTEPPKPSQPTSSPRTANPAEDNDSGKDTYTGASGKKQDNLGCSTPTDARSAHNTGNRTAQNSKRPPAGASNTPVCTTSGGDEATKPHR